jgi:tyrosine-protein kinase Etk/Wzc
MHDIGRILRRRWPVALLTFGITLGGTLYLTGKMPDVYQAEARVQVDNPSNAATLPGELMGLLANSNASALATEFQILQSRPVMRELKRRSRSPLTIEELRSKITLSVAPGGQIVIIAAKADDPVEARVLANTMVYVYRDDVERRNERTADQAVARLRRERGRALARKARAEAAVRTFMAQEGTSDPSDRYSARAKQTNELRAALEQQRISLGLTRAERAKVAEQLRTMPEFEVGGYGLTKNPVIDEYRKKNYDLRTDRERLLLEVTPEADEVVAIDRQIAANEEAIRQALNDQFSQSSKSVGRNPNHATAVTQLITLDRTTAGTARAIRENENLLRSLQAEQRVLASRRTRYEDLTREQASALAAFEKLRQGEYAILERARTSEPAVQTLEQAITPEKPIGPNRPLNRLLALFLGGFLALVTALMAEYLSATRRRPEEFVFEQLPRVAGVPLLAAVPTGALAAPSGAADENGGLPAVIAHADQGAVYTEDALRELGYCLLHLREKPRDPAPAVLLVPTRSGDESGAAVAAQLVATLVRDGLRITLVDADRIQPRLNRVFGAPDAPGLADVLAGRARVGDIFHVGANGSLRFLAAGSPGDATPFTERGLRRVFADLRRDTDLLIVSGPSAFSVPLVGPLQRAADGVVLVTPPGAPAGESVARARRLLTNGFQPNVLGVVLGESAPTPVAAAPATDEPVTLVVPPVTAPAKETV